MFALIFAAAVAAGAPANPHHQLEMDLRQARSCVANRGISEPCLALVRKTCIARFHAEREAGLLAYCLTLENDAREMARENAEAAVLAKLGIGTRPSAVEAKRGWETFRDRWCRVEGRIGPRAVTGDAELNEQECRARLMRQRTAELHQILGWLNP
jgi:hypothetical protein